MGNDSSSQGGEIKMISGFWRTWQGHILYVLEHNEDTKEVFCDSPLGRKTFSEEFFLSEKVDVGPVGDMIIGTEPPRFVPCAKKIIGYDFLRHSGSSTWITPKLEKD